jgi:hypothetical protein
MAYTTGKPIEDVVQGGMFVVTNRRVSVFIKTEPQTWSF